MSYPVKKEDRKYTYGDYRTWPDGERWELINGIAYNMSPAPSRRHQEILLGLAAKFHGYLIDKTCKAYIAPFDVRLPEGNEADDGIETVVQPDLTVVCDKTKLDEKGCKGSPDLIVEIISPSTAAMDYIKKLALYERKGVKEYWIVHPTDKLVTIFKTAADGRYGRPEIFTEDDEVAVGIFDDFKVNLGEVFAE
jgi:Uma2 family endonuclease